jgi:hypothetical protein
MAGEFAERRMSVDSKLCEEKHKAIDEWKEDFNLRVERDIQALFNRLNWFYVIAVATLAATVANFFKG